MFGWLRKIVSGKEEKLAFALPASKEDLLKTAIEKLPWEQTKRKNWVLRGLKEYSESEKALIDALWSKDLLSWNKSSTLQTMVYVAGFELQDALNMRAKHAIKTPTEEPPPGPTGTEALKRSDEKPRGQQL